MEVNEYCQKFGVGDTIIIREWDDMEREFGTDEDGDILVGDSYFDVYMMKYCGVECKVIGMDETGHYIIEPVDTNLKTLITQDERFTDGMLRDKGSEDGELSDDLSRFLLSIMK